MYSQPLPPRGGADDGDDKEKRPPTGSSSHPHHGTPHGLLLHPSRDALRSRVGAIATHASQVTRRRRISLNIAVMATLALYVAVELARYVFAGEHCDALPASAPVAILLVGSVRDVNATHCGAATHVIAPLRRRGHRVSLFFAVDEEEEEDAAAAGRRTEKGAEKAMEGIRRRRARSRALFGEEDAIVAPSSSIPPSSVAAALERVRREHDLDHVEVIPTAPTPTPSACVAALDARVNGPQPVVSSSTGARGIAPNSVAASRRRDAVATVRKHLSRYRARKIADDARVRRERATGVAFAWVVLARPDVAFADDLPIDRACVVPGGRRVNVPWFHGRGGVNDRFMMGPPEGAAEYLSLYDQLCPDDVDGDDADDVRFRKAAAKIPTGVDSSERMYAWHMRRRHVKARSVSHWSPYDRVVRVVHAVPRGRTFLPGVCFSPPAPRFQSRHTSAPFNSV